MNRLDKYGTALGHSALCFAYGAQKASVNIKNLIITYEKVDMY